MAKYDAFRKIAVKAKQSSSLTTFLTSSASEAAKVESRVQDWAGVDSRRMKIGGDVKRLPIWVF
ncbi:Uncharacterized protein APZ42_025878 [Daphnia magna]|uniref:Uncharacterized protein n=1 Tax=Daphnia magna TaxID=35525 RepID=A0A164SPR5_9CRUS|nr:Uncharacterized protein APZ42_025878 [Daphnia magna]